MVFMDKEIEQLLHSLNVTTENVATDPVEQNVASGPAEQRGQPLPPPPVLPTKHARRSLGSWIRKHEPGVLWVGCTLLIVKAGILAFFFFHGVPEGWISRVRRTLRIQEAPVIEEMAPIPHSNGVRLNRFSDELFPQALPQGSLADGSLFQEHLDILRAASGRRKALEEVRHDVDALMANCIHAPDRAATESLHRALVRFDATDLDLTHSLISMILAKRPLLKTPQDVQQLNETLSLAGLGHGLEEYSTVLAQIASTKTMASELLSKLETDRDVVSLANNLEATMHLLDGLHKNPVVASSMDIQGHRRIALERCRHSLEQIMALPSQQPHRCSQEERLSIAYLQRAFPEISMDMWARLDGSLVPLSPTRLAVLSENEMDGGGVFAETARVTLPPEMVFPTNGPDGSCSIAEHVSSAQDR
jgi:hypothetical protein